MTEALSQKYEEGIPTPPNELAKNHKEVLELACVVLQEQGNIIDISLLNKVFEADDRKFAPLGEMRTLDQAEAMIRETCDAGHLKYNPKLHKYTSPNQPPTK